MKILILIFVIFFVSCRECKYDNSTKTSLGIVKSAKVIPTSFNELQKTQVDTTTTHFVIIGLPVIILEKEVFVNQVDCGGGYRIATQNDIVLGRIRDK